MRLHGSRRRRAAGVGYRLVRIFAAIFVVSGMLLFFVRMIEWDETELEAELENHRSTQIRIERRQNPEDLPLEMASAPEVSRDMAIGNASCATVEEMGAGFAVSAGKESLRIRMMIRDHFALNGAPRVRNLPPDEFCKRGFVLAKASEAGFGNEMYKILSASALSLLLNRSLIIGQTRGKYPFGEYISYTTLSFNLSEVKHLWRQNKCILKHRRHLVMRIDNFESPGETNVLCSDWKRWKEPIIWLDGTTDAVGIQFFLKNINPKMRNAALTVFGDPRHIDNRPNVFGELMRVIISPSQAVEEAVAWVLKGGDDPDITLHMRMLGNRPVRAIQASLNCIKNALDIYKHYVTKPRIAVVSDTPSVVKDIKQSLNEFAEVLHFDYRMFQQNITSGISSTGDQVLEFRRKDWGPMPRWVAFVDFFLASRAKYAVISGAHRRVGTTYAQLLSAFAAARQLDEHDPANSSFAFFSSFHSNLLEDGLANQVGWGHVWNRFAGQLSCRGQTHQCAFTTLLPSAWWDSRWQSPISRDVRRLQSYGVRLTDSGMVDESDLLNFCKSRKDVVKVVSFTNCKNSRCT